MNNYILILGFHKGDNYVTNLLDNNHKIIGVDASYKNLLEATKNYKQYPNLTLINKCIYNIDNINIPFYLSTNDEWSSLDKNIAERFVDSEQVTVNTITLNTLLTKYGCPLYLKIDIEGYDENVLRQLLKTTYRPKFISCETECLGKDYEFTYNKLDGLTNINLLKDLGYTKFFLHNENYNDFELDLYKDYCNEWKSYNEIKNDLLALRKQFCEDVANKKLKYFTFWYDIYATY